MTFAARQIESVPILDAYEVRSLAQYETLREELAVDLKFRRETELSFICRDEPSFVVPGYCSFCDRPSAVERYSTSEPLH